VEVMHQVCQVELVLPLEVITITRVVQQVVVA
jgi:hypothetical protein